MLYFEVYKVVVVTQFNCCSCHFFHWICWEKTQRCCSPCSWCQSSCPRLHSVIHRSIKMTWRTYPFLTCLESLERVMYKAKLLNHWNDQKMLITYKVQHSLKWLQAWHEGPSPLNDGSVYNWVESWARRLTPTPWTTTSLCLLSTNSVEKMTRTTIKLCNNNYLLPKMLITTPWLHSIIHRSIRMS